MSNFSNDVPTTIGRLLVAILVIFSYPLQSHPDRVSLDNLFRVFAIFYLLFFFFRVLFVTYGGDKN